MAPRKSRKRRKEVYVVEDVLERRIRKGTSEYLIKWEGFSEEWNTWEPESNIIDKTILKKFTKIEKEVNSTCFHAENSAIMNDIREILDEKNPGSNHSIQEGYEVPVTDEIPERHEMYYKENISSEASDFSRDDDLEDPSYNPVQDYLEDDNSAMCNVDREMSYENSPGTNHSPENYEEVQDIDNIETHERPSEVVDETYSYPNGESSGYGAPGPSRSIEECNKDFEMNHERIVIHNDVIIPQVRKTSQKREICVQYTTKNKKKNFCLYCKGSFTQIPRHLEKKHPLEAEVQKFSMLPKNCTERKKIIDILRKRGNFQHNGDFVLNTGTIIPTRRAGQANVPADKYIPCANCLGYYSKVSIRKHYKICSQDQRKSGKRDILVLGRRVEAQISPKANMIVRNHIFPVMRDDEVTNPLRYDDLVITYANKMTSKFPNPHHYPMIRSKLRLIGKIINEVMKIDPSVVQCTCLFTPKQYDNIIKAIQTVAQLDHATHHFKSPSTASASGTLLKKIANVYIAELIKEEDANKKMVVENFIKLMEVDFGTSINKTVTETQIKNKRSKKVILPTIEDIKVLNVFLRNGREKYYNLLKKSFDLKHYVELQKYLLTSIQVFNRRRAGEVQRIELTDFHNLQTLQDQIDQDLFVPGEVIPVKKSYSRFTIRGKLGREVPVLLYNELVDCIELLIKFRKEANLDGNPFIFGVTGTVNSCMDACSLMREYSKVCGAKKPETLRGTTLRKQVATQSIMFNLNETEVSELANFMGHAEKIHREHYRMPIATREITRMSRLLEMAQGDADETDDEDEIVDGGNANTLVGFSNCIEDPNNNEVVTISRKCEDSLKRRSTSPRGKIPRRSWQTPEKNIIKQVFKDNFEKRTLPSLAQCERVRISYPEISYRSPEQIKVWINNQFVKGKKTGKGTGIKRTTWTSAELSIVEKVFEKNIFDGILPSLNKCRQVINDNPALKNRTDQQVKLWVSNQIRKIRKYESDL